MRNFFSYIGRILVRENIPVWLSLLLMIFGALSAYVIAPVINEKFQIQIAKREFLVSSMVNFADDTKSFIDGVGVFINEDSPTKEARILLLSKAANLNFSAVQLAFVIPEEKKLLLGFQTSLNEIQGIIAVSENRTDKEDIVKSLKILSEQSLNIYKTLAETAGFE